MEGCLSAQRFHALADQLNRTPVRTAATTGLKRRDRALTCRFVEKSRTPPTSRGRPGLSQQSAPGGIRTPNLLIRNQMLYPLSYGRIAASGIPCATSRKTTG